MIKDMTREEACNDTSLRAKREIEKLLRSGRTLYFSDIADELALDLEMVVDICDELLKEGKIGIDEDALARL